MSNLAHQFEVFLLESSDITKKTLRNYRADLANFLTWSKTFLSIKGIQVTSDNQIIPHFSSFLVKEYIHSQTVLRTPPATINRRLSTLRAFGKFLVKSGYVKDNTLDSFQNVANPKRPVLSASLNFPLSPLLPVSPPSPLTTVVPTSPVTPLSPPVLPPVPVHNTKAFALAGISALILLTFFGGLFLGKSNTPKPKIITNKDYPIVLGISASTQNRYPLPAPGITFGDLLSR